MLPILPKKRKREDKKCLEKWKWFLYIIERKRKRENGKQTRKAITVITEFSHAYFLEFSCRRRLIFRYKLDSTNITLLSFLSFLHSMASYATTEHNNIHNNNNNNNENGQKHRS